MHLILISALFQKTKCAICHRPRSGPSTACPITAHAGANPIKKEKSCMLDNLTAFWNNHSVTLISLGYKALLAIAILIASTLIAKTIRRKIQNTNPRLQKLDATLIPILSAVTGYVVYTIAGVFILDIFGINTASLIALVGAAGLAIGLASRSGSSHRLASRMYLLIKQDVHINKAGCTY